MKRRALSLLFFTASATLPAAAWAQAAQPTGASAAQAKPGAAPPAAQAKKAMSPAEEVAQQAVAAAQKDDLEGAIELFRQAYRIDHNARWLYNLGVLHDRLAECDDAAFFYRAALWGKGVLPQDKDAVDNRLGVLEDECHFKARHATQQDRHNRAKRYIGQNMCFLAEAILTGIATPDEKKQLEECKAREKALLEKVEKR